MLPFDVQHYSRRRALLAPVNVIRRHIAINDGALHSYSNVPRLPAFTTDLLSALLKCHFAYIFRFVHGTRPWTNIQRVIDKFHHHTYEYALYTDMGTLFSFITYGRMISNDNCLS